MSAQIIRYKGRVVDTPGDNLLAEFASVVDAVQCAVEIQKKLKEKNEDLPDDRRLEFRIGVNIGDVIQDGDSLYGEGVNIAARIESLADAGGVCISRNAYDHVKNKLTLGYDYIGEHSVKNIKDPVRAYKLLMADEDVGKLIGDVPKSAAKNWIWAAVVVTAIVIAAAASFVYQRITMPEIEPAEAANMVNPLPEKPSIAVLPFNNMSNDSSQDYFSDGLTEEIITGLSMTDQLFVIARNSTFVYKDNPVKIKQVAEELGVRYVLEGSVRIFNDQVRITAQLIDAIEGHHLWSSRYDSELKDIFVLQDEITMKIVTSLRVKLTEGEHARIFYESYRNPEVYYKHLKSYDYWRKGDRESLERYGQLANEIVELAPESQIGYRLLGWYHKALIDYRVSPRENFKKAFAFAQKALSIDNSDPLSHSLMCSLYLWMREFEKSIASGKRSVELQPNGHQNHLVLGITLCYAERFDEAIFHTKKAIRLNPFPAYYDYYNLGRCYYMKGLYDEALVELKKALQCAPNNAATNLFLAIVHIKLNNEEEARLSAKRALEISPNISVSYVSKTWRFKSKDGLKVTLDAMRRAGFPD